MYRFNKPKRKPFNTPSNRYILSKSKLIEKKKKIKYVKKKKSKICCFISKKKLNGVSKKKRSISRSFGGTLSHKIVSKNTVLKFLYLESKNSEKFKNLKLKSSFSNTGRFVSFKKNLIAFFETLFIK